MEPRFNSLVKFDRADIPDEIWETHYKEKFENKHFIYLGEIPNMESHCTLLEVCTGEFLVGYHTNDFIELTDEET